MAGSKKQGWPGSMNRLSRGQEKSGCSLITEQVPEAKVSKKSKEVKAQEK